LKPDAKVFKAHGPVLLEQSLVEARDLVGKRLGYIRAEIERVEALLKELQTKGQRVQSEIIQLSNEPVQKEGK
jgi:prefoldin beta subunit